MACSCLRRPRLAASRARRSGSLQKRADVGSRWAAQRHSLCRSYHLNDRRDRRTTARCAIPHEKNRSSSCFDSIALELFERG